MPLEGDLPPAPESFHAFLLRLTTGAAEPIPEGEGWADLIGRINVEGRIHRIEEETYWYFLEVLPPRWMNGSAFAFAEGQDPLSLFWQRGRDDATEYFTRRLTDDEIARFCRYVGLPRQYGAY